MSTFDQSYHRVASLAEAAAEDTSQAAKRATIHAMMKGSTTTMCGRLADENVQRMGVIRIVDCPDCREKLIEMNRKQKRDETAQTTDRMADEIKQTNIERDAATLNKLRACCGYVENGSQEKLTISQDECTKGWSIRIGTERIATTVPLTMHQPRSYHADGFHEVIDMAYAVEKQEN